MSKKRKLILAAAVFSAALFAASCGGGGGTTAGTGGGSGGSGGSGGGGGGGGGGTQPPPATVEAKVLAVLTTGTVTAGPVNPVAVCELKDDNKAYCGNDLNPSENAVLWYVHEFPNGNVVLVGPGNVLYFFDASSNTLTKLTTFKALNGTSGTVATGITIPNNSRYYANDNFVYIYNGDFATNTSGNLVAISNTGNVIRDNTVLIRTDDANSTHVACDRVIKGPTVYSLNVNGTATATGPIPEVLAQAGGRFLVAQGSAVYLTTDRCSVGGILVDNIANNQHAYMVRFGDDFFIAVRDNTPQVFYYRVSTITNTVTHIFSNAPGAVGGPVGISAGGNNNFAYALAGNGFLFVRTAADTVSVFDTSGNAVGNQALGGGDTVDGLLAFTDRVLVRATIGGNGAVREVDSAANIATPTGVTLTALEICTNTGNNATADVNGRATAFIRCVADDNRNPNPPTNGQQERISVIANNAAGNYASSFTRINTTSTNGATAIALDNTRSGPNAVLSLSRNNAGFLGPINLCTITPNLPTSITISCSTTDIPNPVGNIPLGDTTRIYNFVADPVTGAPTPTDLLKFNGNNVFYLSGTSVRFRNLFSTTASSLPIAVIGASGGNASFDLTKFTFSFRPHGAPCNTQIAYFSSPTAAPKFYTIAQPSNTCANNILKVFP
jgi:hypothetical protein